MQPTPPGVSEEQETSPEGAVENSRRLKAWHFVPRSSPPAGTPEPASAAAESWHPLYDGNGI
jgi:hypothetical protein